MQRVAADDRRRSLQVNALEFRGMCEERIRGEVDPGRDRASQIVTVLGQSIEGGGGAEVNDAGRSAVQMQGRNGVRDAVRSDCFGIFVTDPYAGLNPRINYQRFLMQVFTASLQDALGKLRNDRGQANPRKVLRR